MAVLTIGRVGLASPATNGVGLVGPATGLSWSGDELSFSGEIVASTVADAKVLRDQVRGLAGNQDEPVVPVTWDEDSTVNGYYRVESAEVGTVAASYSANWFPIDVTLVRVPGWQAPMVEVIARGADADTNHGVSSWSWIGGPISGDVSATQFSGLVNNNGANGASVQNEDGAQAFWYANTADRDDLYNTELVYSVAETNYYDASCRIEMKQVDDTYDVVVGRQIESDPSSWRLRNGQCQVTCSTNEPSFTVGVWDGTNSVYVDKKYDMLDQISGLHIPGNTGPGTPPRTVTVLRNSPEMVALRVWYNDTTTDSVQCDFTLRRGAWWVEVAMSDSESGHRFEIVRSTTEASTAVTGGADATSVDGDGYTFQVRSTSPTTNSTDGGVFLTSTSNNALFGVGLDAGRGIVSASFSELFFARMAHRQQIAVR